MSQNPVDLDRAIEALREDLPQVGVEQRALQRIVSPQRRNAWTPALATGLAVALIVWAAFPRREQGVAFAEVLKRFDATPSYHCVNYAKDGRKVVERWKAPGKRALILWRNGKLIYETRSDGHRTFSYLASTIKSPNSIDAGWLRNVGHDDLLFDEDPQTIDFLLKGRAAKQLGVVRHGDLDRYFVLSYGTKITVDVDPKTRHIESILTPGGDRIQYDYPERIDPAIFVPRPQLVPGVKVFDFELDRARQAALVKRGIARKGDTVLRSVILDRYGCLWVFWTGYVPDGRLTKGYSVPGMPLGPASEPGYFTTSWNKHWPNRRYMVDGRQLVGMNRAPKQKIGTRITVKVPTKGGYVTFQNVPVQRILEYTEVLPAYEKVPRPGRM